MQSKVQDMWLHWLRHLFIYECFQHAARQLPSTICKMIGQVVSSLDVCKMEGKLTRDCDHTKFFSKLCDKPLSSSMNSLTSVMAKMQKCFHMIQFKEHRKVHKKFLNILKWFHQWSNADGKIVTVSLQLKCMEVSNVSAKVFLVW